MRWFLVTLIWWCGASAIPSPSSDIWTCPEIFEASIVECTCDMPHTLRCVGAENSLLIIGNKLKESKTSISLLDCSIQNISVINGPLLNGISLHGLVISSGELNNISSDAFEKLKSPLQALGLPNNKFSSVPIFALKSLPELDRLDLSGNKIKTLDSNSFGVLKNLSFLDVSNNVVARISQNTFSGLLNLKTLRLRGNKLKMLTIMRLNNMPDLDDFDISQNIISDPLGPNSLPSINSLKDLDLSHNFINSIKTEALRGVKNLQSLILHHNQIDVIEDNAFLYLSNLIDLDLSHNRIVAVSSTSLAHLKKLISLDLNNNHLRAITSDLILPLKSLQSLKLDDNDISIIDSNAFINISSFKHLVLTDNPLNCDCNLKEFSKWLVNSSLPDNDKESAVCTTPPSLENGLLIKIPPNNFFCEDEEKPEPLYKKKINLKDYSYDGTNVKLLWSIDKDTTPYSCDAIYVYEEKGFKVVPLDTIPLKCNSTHLKNPHVLQMRVPEGIELKNYHRYVYCLALFQQGVTDDLILGCSDVIPLVQIQNHLEQEIAKIPKVISVQGNLTANGNLSIYVRTFPVTNCTINLILLDQEYVLLQRELDCLNPEYNLIGLTQGPYRICANIIYHSSTEQQKAKCITVFNRTSQNNYFLIIAMLFILSVLCFILLALVVGIRRILVKSKIQTHQCYIAPDSDKDQHNRYVKLLATTKV